MYRIEKTKKLHDRLGRYDKKRNAAKRKKLREDLMIGEKVVVFAEITKKKTALGKFYKQSVQNRFIILNIIGLEMLKITKNLQKDFTELNYLLQTQFCYVNQYCIVII